MKIFSYLPMLLLGLSACGGSDNKMSASEDLVDAPATMPITIEAKTPGTDFPDATILDWNYQNGIFSYDLAPGSYQLGVPSPDAGSTMCANSDKGQHIHLILDNEPYIAKYEAMFQQAVADGEHHILSFLSRSYHESIKTASAHRAIKARVEKGAFASTMPITDPMLFYSRPKGEYVGRDAENILLDFYPVNATLGDQYKVKVEIGDFNTTLDKWQPYIIRGLPMGDHTVTLTLVDGEGKKVETPLNPVSRTFTLIADPMPGQ